MSPFHTDTRYMIYVKNQIYSNQIVKAGNSGGASNPRTMMTPRLPAEVANDTSLFAWHALSSPPFFHFQII